MIRIKPRRCGYGGEKGYTCQRLPQLQDWMFNEEIPFIAQMKAEFDKLPLRVKGMVYTEETIDMGWSEFGPHPEVPELTCRSNTDPASDTTDVSVWGETGIPVDIGNATAYPVYGGSSGWLDLFNSGYEITGGTQYFYHNVSGTTAATSDVYIKVTGVDHEYHDIYLVSNIPTFKNGEQEMEMGPGLLEPMLDTDFAPVGIDTIPAWEAGLDADIFTNIVLNAWKGVIDDRIRNIYWRLNNIPILGTDQPLRELKREEYKDAECDNFQIVLASGNSLKDDTDDTVTSSGTVEPTFHVGDRVGGKVVVDLWNVVVSGTTTWYWTLNNDTTPNTYNVTSGVIQIGPYTCTVPAVTGIYAPFYAYLTTSPLEYTKSSGVTDLPVVEGSTITNGTVMPDGGTVYDLTYHATGDDPGWSWTTNYDHTVDAAGTINIKTAHELNENGTADPPADGIGIGGVRIITGAGSDPLTLYKVYHEDCIASAPLEGDAAQVNTKYPSNVPEDDGPEYPPDVVYPYDNIRSGTTGTNRLEWGHSAYVPTVNATYEFIHSEIYGATAVDPAQALAYAYVTQGGRATDGSTYELTVANITFKEPERDRAIAANALIDPVSATLDEATEAYDAAKTAWEDAGSPTDPNDPIYQAYIAAEVNLTNAQRAYNTVSSAATFVLSGGTPGTAFVLTELVVSGGTVLGASAPDVSVPSVDAVRTFIHDPGALNTWGTVVQQQGTSPKHVAHGTPGTVYTVDAVDYDLYIAGGNLGYYYSEVPTVHAMVDYVAAHGGVATDAVAGYIDITGTSPNDKDTLEDVVIPSGTEGVAGTTITAKAGLVQPSHNIKVHDTPEKRSASPVDVPTVEAVYNFVHSLSGSTDYKAGVGFPISDAKATPAGMTVIPDTSVTLNASAVPGTYFVASTIETTTVNSVLTTAADCVPTAQAVVTYVKTVTPGQTPDSVAGTLKVTRTEDTTVDPPTVTITESWNDPQPTRGTVQVAKGVLVAADSTKRNLTPQAVPSVNAVFTFIHGTAVYTSGATEYAYALARPGLIKLGTESPYVDGWDSTDGGEPGTTYIAKNICVNPGAASTVGVPTVQAVYAFVHEISIAAPAAGSTASRAIATGASVTAPVSGTVATLTTGATPGTCYVVTDMIGMQGAGVTLSTSYTVGGVACTLASVVPTVEAVKGYVDLVAGGTPSVVGYMIVSNSNPYESIGNIGNTVATAGTVWTVENILMNSTDDATHRPKSKKTVPTVEAVINYIRGTTISGTDTESSLAVAGSITPTPATGAPTAVAFSGGQQGVVKVTSNIIAVNGETSCTDCVPTADAVTRYIDGLNIGPADPGKIVGGNATETWDPDDGATRGTVLVASNVAIGTSVAGQTISTEAVPTVMAVHTFVSGYTATIGGFTATSSAEEWISASTASPGIFSVVSTIAAAASSSGNRSLSITTVPTVAAVKDYVDGHGGGYDGPFKVNSDGTVEGGDVYFAGAVIKTAAKRTTALTNGQTAWLVVTKTGASTYTATIETSATNNATAVSYPLAKNVNGTMTQLHYGVVNITGRWM